MKRGEITGGVRVERPGGGQLHQIEEYGKYKYPGELEADDIKHNKIKNKIYEKYTNRVIRELCSLS